MTLTRAQINQIVDILVPHVNGSEEDRRTLIRRAFEGESVVAEMIYSGLPPTFAMNCIDRLQNYKPIIGISQLLQTLHDYYVSASVGEQISGLITDLGATSAIEARSDSVAQHATIVSLDAQLFISYSRKDSAFVNKLRGDLGKHGIPYWIDQEGLSPGTPNWERAIREAIRKSSAVLWIVSPAANDSEYVYSELAIAEMYKRRIYPAWADGNQWVDCVPMGRHRIQHVDMRGEKYPVGWNKLLAALRRTDSEYIVPSEESVVPPATVLRNPYKGLNAFTENDEGDFFGRSALTATLLERLRAQLDQDKARFLAVLGPSGAGKSSVVMAGLLPTLKRGGVIPGSGSWRYLPTITPGTHPMESIAGAFASVMSSADATAVLNKLYKLGMDYVNIMCEVLPAERVVLYIDQFEELFTLAKDNRERQDFINLLSHMVSEPNGKMIVILSMRADFLDYPLNYPQLGSLFDKYTALVQPMSITELRDAIQKPAHLSGLIFDDGLVADIVFALRGQDKAIAGALPLLQFSLQRLYEERAENRLTREAYVRMGGVNGAIGTHSESVFRALPEAAQQTLGQVFLPLVNIDEETGEPTRRRAPLADIIADSDAETLVNAFVDNGLLQRGRDGDYRYLEVTHEALLRSWMTLAMWIAEVRGDLYLLRELRKAAALWVANERSRDFLWLGDRGRDAQAMISRLHPNLNDLEQAFARPEAEHLLDELADTHTVHPRRSEISTRLHQLEHRLRGAGVGEDGVPEIVWLPVNGSEGKKHRFKFGEFEVRSFHIAQYLVTYEQYQVFVEAEDGFENTAWWEKMPEADQKQELEKQRQPYINYPRDSVSWYQAVAFARWMNQRLQGLALPHPGGMLRVGENAEVRLPTEWEWQWAAQGGVEERQYPWRNWQEGYANTNEAGLNRTTAVGMYPQGAAVCGALDMAGNLMEWCQNDYENPEIVDGYGNGETKVLRGGAFHFIRSLAAAAARDSYDPYSRYGYYGVRLVVGRPL